MLRRDRFGGGRGASVCSEGLGAERVQSSKGRRFSDSDDAVSRVPEEPGPCGHGNDGSALDRAVGWRAHQVLVVEDNWVPPGRSGVRHSRVSGCWARPAFVEEYGRTRVETGENPGSV